MVKLLRRLVALLLLAALVGVVVYATLSPQTVQQIAFPGKGGRQGGGGGKAGGDLPVPVLMAEVKRTDVPVVLVGVGTARALNTVTIRSQVDGRIVRIAFREGQDVKAGDLLAEIDSATYRAQLDQALAKRLLTQTQLDNARRDLERYQRIPGVIAQKTVDTQQAQVAQLEAQIKADEAAIANAQTMLGYTRITAPFAGRAGMRAVDEGNLVRAGDSTGIVTVTQVQPIAVLFTLPQQQLAQVNRALARGTVPVEALDAEGRGSLGVGTLSVVDNQVDQQTGTVRMKAEFANESLQMWPGQFVNVRVTVDVLKDAVTIPVAAVQRGPSGTFAYAVGAESRAQVRPVTLGLVNESDAVVTAGLEAGQRVVTSGFARLSDGARVFTPPGAAAPSASEPAAKPAASAGEGANKGDGAGRSKGEGRGEGKGEGRRRREAAPGTAQVAPQAAPQGATQ